MKNKRIVRLAALAMCLIMCFAATSCTFVSAAAAKATGYLDFILDLVDAVKRGDIEEAEKFLHPQAIVTVEDIERMLQEQEEDINAFYKADPSDWLNAGNSLETFDINDNVKITHCLPAPNHIKTDAIDEYALRISLIIEPKASIDNVVICIIGDILNNEQGVGIYYLEIC